MVSGTSEYLRDFIGIVTLFGDNVGRMLEEDQRREAAKRVSCPARAAVIFGLAAGYALPSAALFAVQPVAHLISDFEPFLPWLLLGNGRHLWRLSPWRHWPAACWPAWEARCPFRF
jgi:hypothetical protein